MLNAANRAKRELGSLDQYQRPNRIKDITGKKFGKLTVVGICKPDLSSKKKRVWWVVECKCGRSGVIASSSLIKTRSCGCLQAQKTSDGRKGMSAYNSWQGMRARCFCPTNPKYPRYGARGITVCERWDDFKNFLADMGERPKGMTLDRKDNNGNYEPDNCRWATPVEQSRNTRRNIWVTHNGKTMLPEDWEKEMGIDEATIRYRIKAGWSHSDAVTKPSRIKNHPRRSVK